MIITKVTHDLKIAPPYYYAVESGQKTFEIRKNDRRFQVGDKVNLRMWSVIENKYIGNNVLKREIIYITDYEQKENYVVFGIKKLNSEGGK